MKGGAKNAVVGITQGNGGDDTSGEHWTFTDLLLNANYDSYYYIDLLESIIRYFESDYDYLPEAEKIAMFNDYQRLYGEYCEEKAKHECLKTITHELGHALKMSHVFTESEHTRYYTTHPIVGDSKCYEAEVLSCMNYSAIDSSGYLMEDTFDTFLPTFLDKYNLIRKWGVH